MSDTTKSLPWFTLSGEIVAQDEQVHQEPDHPFEVHLVPRGDGRTRDLVGLTGVTEQHGENRRYSKWFYR